MKKKNETKKEKNLKNIFFILILISLPDLYIYIYICIYIYKFDSTDPERMSAERLATKRKSFQSFLHIISFFSNIFFYPKKKLTSNVGWRAKEYPKFMVYHENVL